MNKLTEARNVLKNLYFMADNYDPETALIITSFPGWTMLVTPNIFGEEFPMVDIIRDSDLLKLYGYSERFFDGDEVL